MRTVTMTLAQIKAWAIKMQRRNLRREGFSLLPRYLAAKVKALALWTDGKYFDLPELWRVSMYRWTR